MRKAQIEEKHTVQRKQKNCTNDKINGTVKLCRRELTNVISV